VAGPSTASGAWRPNRHFNARPGLQITMSRERGLTPQGYLSVPFRFQAPPIDRWGREWSFNYDTYATVGEGEKARAQGVQLKRPSFSTMFVDEFYRWQVWNGSLDVQRMVKELRLILEEPAPFRLVIGQPALWGAEPLLTMRAVLVNLRAEQRGGELGTEYADVEFLEFGRERLTTKGRERRQAESDQERRYTVKPGDTLYEIAEDMYKRRSFWHTIANANGITKVSPDSSEALEDWMASHDRKSLKVPPLTGTAKQDPKRPNAASGVGRA
jgi:hypothetical protein